MRIMQNLATLALYQVVGGALQAVGLGSGADAVAGFLTERFTDHSQRLTKALQSANERAWKSLEVALAGESLWNKLAPADDQAFRAQVRAFLDGSPFKGQNEEVARIFLKALEELRAARTRGLLTEGSLAPAELARHAGAFASFNDPQAQLEAERAVIEQSVQELRESYPNLRKVLLAKAGGKPTPSLLVIAVRYYFRREVESDPELFRGLSFAKLEAIKESQDRGFSALTEALTRQGQRLEELLVGLDEKIQRLEQQIQRLLDQLQLQNREGNRSAVGK